MRSQRLLPAAILSWLPILLLLLVTVVAAQDICYPDSCFDPDTDNFYSYRDCCEEKCCTRLRFFVIPASFVGAAFVLGAFFALCFQCR